MFSPKLIVGALALAVLGTSAFAGDPFKEAQKEATTSKGNQALVIRQESNGKAAELFTVPASEVAHVKALRNASPAERSAFFDSQAATLVKNDAKLGASDFQRGDNDQANQACYGYYYFNGYYAPVTYYYYYYPAYVYYPVYYTYYYYQWNYYYSGYNYVVYY